MCSGEATSTNYGQKLRQAMKMNGFDNYFLRQKFEIICFK